MAIRENVLMGKDSFAWHPDLCNLYGCRIGTNTRIGTFCEIRTGVVIGDNCRLQAFVFIPEGVTIGNNVFIGPHVCFTNDKHPSAPDHEWERLDTIVEDGANIGANATILPGITIGKEATIGAGAVVTKNVPAGETWIGNPAKKLDKFPFKLKEDDVL